MPWMIRSLAVGAAAALLCGCNDRGVQVAAQAVGDAGRGARLISAYGCGACHQIPGISGANGLVAPPLTAMGRRTLIAGLLPNTPPEMIRWLQTPQAVVPGNGMPNMGMSEHDARDIAAYLYTLR